MTQRVIAIEHLTLDGVYQEPARPGRRDGSGTSGWGVSDDDPDLQRRMGDYMSGGWSLLVGRTTYEELHQSWAVQMPESPMAQALGSVQKFVVTHDKNYALRWENSTLLAGDAAETVGTLKAQHDTPLIIFGSGVLTAALMRRGLVDELFLMIHPLILDSGRRLFDRVPSTALTLVEATTTASGVVLATYRPAAGES